MGTRRIKSRIYKQLKKRRQDEKKIKTHINQGTRGPKSPLFLFSQTKVTDYNRLQNQKKS